MPLNIAIKSRLLLLVHIQDQMQIQIGRLLWLFHVFMLKGHQEKCSIRTVKFDDSNA